MAAFRAELQKAHRRHDLALCLLIPGIVVLWVGGLAPADPEELANGYSALLYSLPVIEAILMPVMMAVLASRLWDMEIKGNTAKLLYTLQSRRSLFAGKAVFGVLEVLLVTVLELACVPVLGRVHGYTEAFPTGQLVYLFVCTLAVGSVDAAAEDVEHQRSNHIAGQREQPLRHQSQKSHKERNREKNNFLQDRHHIRHFLSVRSYYKGIDYCTARMSSIICTPAVLQLREFS